MVKVKALDTYKKNNIQDSELGRIPECGEIFEVSEERIDTLLGENKYGMSFVEVIKEEKKIEKKAILEEDKKKNNVKKATI